LIASKLLNPLGKAVPNTPMYFALVDILERGNDHEWLSSATRSITNYWKSKNGRNRPTENVPQNPKP
jgi:hypothetical protein